LFQTFKSAQKQPPRTFFRVFLKKKVKMSERFSIKEALQLKKNSRNFRVNREMREKNRAYNRILDEF